MRRPAVPPEAVLLLAPLLLLLSGLNVIHHPSLTWLTTWGTTIDFAIAAGLCARLARRPDALGRTWRCFTAACLLWAGANLYYAVAVSPAPIPLPSPADIGYFGFPLMICAGLISHVRHRLVNVPFDTILDGLIAGLTTAAVAAAIINGLGGTDVHNLGAIITSVIYPLEDAVVIGLLVGVVAVLGWQPGRVALILAAAIACITAADIGTFASVLNHHRIGGAAINAGWTTGIALLTIAARVDAGSVPTIRRAPARTIAIPIVFFGVSGLLLVLGSTLDLGVIATALAAAVLAVCSLRLWRAYHEIESLAESRALALTDELTGLANRRRLLADLDRACRGRETCRLVMFDLDGFKAFNDRFGHPDGDRLLSVLAGRLARAVDGHGQAYRLGGDEFCVLLDASAEAATIEAAAAALADHGVGWRVTASFGAVAIPTEASDGSSAMRLADRRMYQQKERRPQAARQQARDVLLSALGEQQPALHAHTEDVTELAHTVATVLGMSAEAIDDVVRAAELHDIGKLAIPREILEKPAALDAAEWQIMRRHTVIGERMLRVAPALTSVAPLVRSSHERWDGGGYPDGLAGKAIPLGARIVAVCDAFDAMVADRPYRRGLPIATALAELQRCAGTQFDPQVVTAFLGVVAAPADVPS